jgi:hypothetical protein
MTTLAISAPQPNVGTNYMCWFDQDIQLARRLNNLSVSDQLFEPMRMAGLGPPWWGGVGVQVESCA